MARIESMERLMYATAFAQKAAPRNKRG